MSRDDESDSQNISKSVSLLSDSDTSATEIDSIFDNEETEDSVTSRPPPEKIIPNNVPDSKVPIINLSDGGSPILDDKNNLDNEDPSLNQDVDAHQMVPKIYVSFLGDVADRAPRVRGTDASSDLLFNSDGSPHFPLFWSLEPHKVPQTPLSLLSDDDRNAVEWLRKQKNIDCAALLENEDNPVGLQTLLGNMPPKSQTTKTMDEVAMLKALRAKERKAKVVAEKNTATSVEYLGTGPEQGDGEGAFCATQKAKKLKKGAIPEGPSSKVGSIFDRRFLIGQIVETKLNQKEDRIRVHKAGMKNLGKKIQSSGAQMAFLGLCVDQYVASAEKELKKALVKNKELTDKLKSVEGDMKTVERLKTDLKASETKNTELVAEKETWDEKYSNMKKAYEDAVAEKKSLEETNKTLETSVTTLTAENKDLVIDKDSLVADLGDTKVEVAMQHAAGFEKAVSQLKFLHPDLEVDKVGPFKHIVDGKLVDIVVDEDEE
ncbi:hypothetical protein SESBI_50442 [Sesbania bispinosa]|nr:hypothetical protein SESBI_50442 [Sesbania bispinosa]